MRRILALVPLGDPALPDPQAATAAAAVLAVQHGVAAEALLVGRPDQVEAGLRDAAREGAAALHAVAHAGLGDPPAAEHVLHLAEAALEALPGPALVVLPAGAAGEELAARLAARLDGVPLGRCAAVAMDGLRLTARRATHGGRAEAVLATEARLVLAVMRRPPAAPAPIAAPAIRRSVSDMPLPAMPAVEVGPGAPGQPRRLEGARVVVSGGRGIGGAEGFARLDEIAALIGGATGASLPAVDAGWAGVSQQVGQSGAFVAPELYLAVGMSGTPQHLAGIALHSRIVAINPDPEADIFRVAELGVVAPWQEVLPRLIAALRDPAPDDTKDNERRRTP